MAQINISKLDRLYLDNWQSRRDGMLFPDTSAEHNREHIANMINTYATRLVNMAGEEMSALYLSDMDAKFHITDGDEVYWADNAWMRLSAPNVTNASRDWLTAHRAEVEAAMK